MMKDGRHFSRFALVSNLVRDLERNRELIEDGLKHGLGATFDDVAIAVLRGDAHLHTMPNSVMVTEIKDYPNAKVLHIFVAAGDMDEIREKGVSLEPIAKAQGCSYITIQGRRGWARAVADLDYKEIGTLVAKELT